MKFLALTFLIILSCSKHEPKSVDIPLELSKKKDVYIDLIGDPYTLVDRCDALTFVSLFCVGGGNVDLSKHEYSYKAGNYTYATGKLNRDKKDCFAAGDSRSSISMEGITGALQCLHVKKDTPAISRVEDYARKNAWIFGDGPKEYTYLPQLAPILSKLLGHKEASEAKGGFDLTGYKSNVILGYIWLHAKAYGYITDLQLAFLRKAHRDSENPIAAAMYHAFSDQNQSEVIETLLDASLFPSDSLPKTEIFDWEGGHSAILFLYTLSIISFTEETL